jgi:tetratricopeptide (TPR) repeat protein
VLEPVRPSLAGKTEIDEDARATLEQAHSALERGDLVEAGTQYMAAARRTPENGDAWLGVSRVLLMAGEFERATELLDRTIAQQDKSKAWLVLSHVLITKGDFDRAAALIDRSIALQPNDPQAHCLQAVIFRHTGHDQGELDSLRRALQCSPKDPQLWDALLTAFDRVCGPDAALEFLDRNHHEVPGDLQVDLRRAQLYVSADRIEEAESRIRELVTAHPDNPEALTVQALLFLKTHRHEDALYSLERATQYSPDDPQLWETLITVLERLRGPDDTIEYLERNHSVVPKDIAIDVRRAHLYVSAGRTQEAESRIRDLITSNPENAALKAKLIALVLGQARLALERRDFAQADTYYRAVVHQAPDNAEALLGLSRALLMTGQLDSAAEAVSRVIASRPKDPEAHIVQASIFRNTGNSEAELTALKRAIRHAPTDSRVWGELTTALERVLGPEAAIEYLENNRGAVPKGVTMDLRKAQLCVSAGQFRKVDLIVRRMLSFLEADPDSIGDHILVARCLAEMGQENVALELLRTLTKRHRITASPFIALADLLRGENTTVSEAILNLQHALTLQPDNPRLLRNLADCHARQSRYNDAADLLITALQMTREAAVPDYFRLGTVLRHAGRAAEADKYLQEALAKASKEVTDSGGDMKERATRSAIVARILIALGRREQAFDHYKRMVQECSGGRLSYDPGLYLPSTPTRLEHLRNRINGRDTLILSHGPSISALAGWGDLLGSLDVCVAAVNRFRVFETGFLSRSGRTVDVLLETHYKAVRQLVDQILGFLERPTNNLFIANRWVMDRLGSSCPSRNEFERRFDDKLLYFGGAGGIQPATPYDPLRYVYGNSLSVLISLMVIGGAKRIFVFGADGGIPHGDSGSTHYGCHKDEFRFDMTDDMREAVSASLRADAMEFPDIIETGFMTAEGLFGVKPPPVFNVSPNSRLDAFPKITYARARSMLSGQE